MPHGEIPKHCSSLFSLSGILLQSKWNTTAKQPDLLCQAAATAMPSKKIPQHLTSTIQTMKRNILALLTVAAALSAANMAKAIPADPQPKRMSQPDGSTVTVMMRGDEHCHLTYTTDGKPLFYNTKTGAFEYATMRGGRLSGSGLTARDADRRTAADVVFLRNQDTEGIEKAAMRAYAYTEPRLQKSSAGTPRRIRINDFPTTGRQKTLVILWEFSDQGFTSVSDPKAFFNGLLNTEGFSWEGTGINGSAHDFYRTASSNMFDPDFVVMGPVKLSHSATYYGEDTGTGTNNGQDARISEAIIESCKALDSEIDFSEYDTDGDGKVDNIYFFYAGNGQADTPNGTNFIWPHSWYLKGTGENGWGKELVLDGKLIDRYTCSNELRYRSDGSLVPTGIGTFVHEFGHVLGLADHYDTSYGMFTFGLGAWDTMATGSYNNDMNTPPTFSAFERAELGWLDYETLDTNADSVNVLPNLADCNKAYRVDVDGTEGREFFVLENRQKTGWDKYLPGHGMLLWHIDIDTTAWNNNAVNTQMDHQRVDIVEVDGVATDATRSADIMPGTANVTQWQLQSWAGDDLLKIDHVAERNDTVRMVVAGTSFRLPAPEALIVSNVEDSSLCVTWTPVEDAEYYKLAAFTDGGNGQRKYVDGLDYKVYPEVASIKVSDLEPLTAYTLSVSAFLASYASDTTEVDATTLPLAFRKKQPQGLTATDITEDAFSAEWNAVDGATDYTVWLNRHAFSENTTAMGYDFGNKYDGMPEMWNTSSQTYYSVKGYFGNEAPSLRLSSDGDWLTVAFPETRIDGLSMWIRSSKSGNKLHIDADYGNGWTEVNVLDAPTAAATLTATADGAQKMRIRLEKAAGFVVVDDVTAQCHTTLRLPVENYNGVKTGGKENFRFSSLTTGETYSYRVQASDGTEDSYKSEECKVTLPVSLGVRQATTAAEGASHETFDLLGRKTGYTANGIVIVKKGDKTIKTEQR